MSDHFITDPISPKAGSSSPTAKAMTQPCHIGKYFHTLSGAGSINKGGGRYIVRAALELLGNKRESALYMARHLLFVAGKFRILPD